MSARLSPGMRMALVRLLSETNRSTEEVAWIEVGAGRGHLDKRSVDALEWRDLVVVDRFRGVARLTDEGRKVARREMDA